jgi:hypothetical protein
MTCLSLTLEVVLGAQISSFQFTYISIHGTSGDWSSYAYTLYICVYIYIYIIFFFSWLVLEYEVRASHFLDVCSNHLSYVFALGYFLNRVLCFLPALNRSPPSCAFCIAGLFVEMEVLNHDCPSLHLSISWNYRCAQAHLANKYFNNWYIEKLVNSFSFWCVHRHLQMHSMHRSYSVCGSICWMLPGSQLKQLTP